MGKMGLSPDAIARAMVFAIEKPADVDVGEIIVRPTAKLTPFFDRRQPADFRCAVQIRDSMIGGVLRTHLAV
jgi:hypothetical protein